MNCTDIKQKANTREDSVERKMCFCSSFLTCLMLKQLQSLFYFYFFVQTLQIKVNLHFFCRSTHHPQVLPQRLERKRHVITFLSGRLIIKLEEKQVEGPQRDGEIFLFSQKQPVGFPAEALVPVFLPLPSLPSICLSFPPPPSFLPSFLYFMSLLYSTHILPHFFLCCFDGSLLPPCFFSSAHFDKYSTIMQRETNWYEKLNSINHHLFLSFVIRGFLLTFSSLAVKGSSSQELDASLTAGEHRR